MAEPATAIREALAESSQRQDDGQTVCSNRNDGWKDVVADLWKSAWELGFLPMADDAVEGLETRQHVAHAQDKSPQDFIEGEIRLHLHELLDLSREERDQVVKEWRIGKPGPATCTAWEAEISSLNSDIESLLSG